MSIEAYYPEMLSINNIKIDDFKDHIMQVNLEIGRFDSMLRYIPQKKLVQAYLRAEEVLSAASLEISDLSFDEYLDKLLDRGYGADDLNEIRFMIDYYKEQDSILKEKGFSLDLLNNFQQKLLDNRKQRIIAQTELYRKRQIWLVEATDGLDVRNHMQPSEDRINELMDNLDIFIKKSNLHPLITAAVAYGQLVMIHPYRYCNGRITGTIIPLLCNDLGITQERTLYLSSAFAKDKDEYYYQLVRLFRYKNWSSWISYFLKKLEDELIELNQYKTDTIVENYKNMAAEIKKTQSALREKYVEVILNKPIFTPMEIVNNNDFIVDTTLYRYLRNLKKQGYLIKDNRIQNMNYMISSLKGLR